jgi:hypothetical protein
MKYAFTLLLLASAPAFAQVAQVPSCESCRAEDEVQVGDYVPPAIPAPRPVPTLDPRGNAHSLPVTGSPTVFHRPGSGVWLGGIGANNVYVDHSRSQSLLRLKRDF